VLRVVYVLATWDHTLAGDEPEYHMQGVFIADGRWFWSEAPYGDPHPSAWKTPGYPLFVGLLYAVGGENPDAVMLVQVLLLGPLTIALTWLLGRRLFGPAVGAAAGFVAAIHPFVWQFEARLFAEALATPLTLAVLLLVLDRRQSTRAIVAAGALSAALILVKPSALHILAAVVVAILVGWGLRGGIPRAALALGVCVLVIAPWTIRNFAEFDALIPLSVQDAGIYGVFNDEAANDGERPWAFRAYTTRDADLFDPENPLPDDELRAELRERALDYIEDNPSAVPKALFWNGVTRFWDLRAPGGALDEVPFQGRSRTLTWIGLVIWWVMLPLAVAGLVLARSRRALVIPLVAMFVLATLVYIGNSGTRYRAPFEPVVAVLACSAVASLRRPTHMRRFWDRRARENPWFFINNTLSYDDPDLDRFWESGERDVDMLLETLGVSLAPGDHVVEIGCGAGRMSRALAARVERVTAIDVAPRMLELARHHNAGRRNVEWLLGDGTSLAGVPDGAADACISYVVLQHIPDPAVILGYVREMGRVLRPGGWAVFQVSNAPGVHRQRPHGPRRMLASLRRRMPRGQRDPAWIGSWVELDDVRAAAGDAGMDVERVVGEGTQFCLVRTRRR
jgi:SAM-dependent methyltransferase